MTRLNPVVLALCAAAMLAPAASADHFLGGNLSWRALKPGTTDYTVQFTVNLGLKRSAYVVMGDVLPIVGDTISEPIGQEATTLSFGDGGSQTLQLKVTSLDSNYDWIYATATVTHVYAGPGPYNALISGCCAAPQTNYSIKSVVNLGAEGNSPVTTMPPVVQCAPSGQSGPCTFQVLGATLEQADVLRYRFATLAEAGYAPSPLLSIDAVTGNVSFSYLLQGTPPPRVQVVVESFHTLNGSIVGNAITNTAVEFSFAANVGGLFLDPLFLAPNVTSSNGPYDPGCGTTVSLTPGQTFQHNFRPNVFNGVVVLNAAGLPAGATSSNSLPIFEDAIFDTILSWTPSPTQVGSYVITGLASTPFLDQPPIQRQCSIAINVYGDADGDNIPDLWETNGYTLNGSFVDLKAMGASPLHKDVFVFLNSYTDPKDTTNTRSLLSTAAISSVVAAYKAAPVTNLDGIPGVALHVVYGNTAIPYNSSAPPLGGPNGSPAFDWTNFDAIKAANFPAQYAPVFRYALFYPYQAGPFPSSTGISRGIPSTDFIVSLGLVARTFHIVSGRTIVDSFGGTDENQAGTFMHELGHALGLTHGGPDSVADPAQKTLSYKPNYFSVMNYSYQLTGIPTSTTPVFDYSQYGPTEVPALNEQNLNETLGFQVLTALVSSPDPGIGVRQSAVQRNLAGAWYCMTNNARTVSCRDSSGVFIPGCTANSPQNFSCGLTPYLSSVTSTLRQSATPGSYLNLISYNDWAYLNYKSGTVGGGQSASVHVAVNANSLHTDPYDPTPELQIQPNPPTGVSARRSGNTVRLVWNPLGSLNSYVYSVYKRVGTSGPFTAVGNPTTSSSLTDTVLTGQTVQYYVNATNAANVTSANSAIVTVGP